MFAGVCLISRACLKLRVLAAAMLGIPRGGRAAARGCFVLLCLKRHGFVSSTNSIALYSTRQVVYHKSYFSVDSINNFSDTRGRVQLTWQLPWGAE